MCPGQPQHQVDRRLRSFPKIAVGKKHRSKVADAEAMLQRPRPDLNQARTREILTSIALMISAWPLAAQKSSCSPRLHGFRVSEIRVGISRSPSLRQDGHYALVALQQETPLGGRHATPAGLTTSSRARSRQVRRVVPCSCGAPPRTPAEGGPSGRSVSQAKLTAMAPSGP